MEVSLVADWLVTFGGAEHVLQELHALYPDAALHTSVARQKSLGPLRELDIRTSYLQPLYRILKRHEPLLPFMPRAFEQIDLSGSDLIISSSHAVGKGVVPPPGATHVCYCHTPMRYAWEMEQKYLADFRIPHWLQPLAKKQLSKLRRWDLATAKRVDLFIANSETTRQRIKRYYGRDSEVLSPPVAEHFFDAVRSHDADNNPYYFAIGRMVPYKRFDLLIAVANERKLPLKIAGMGGDFERLKKLAGPTVEFLGRVPDAELTSLYANAQALLFPQEEDAGIVLLEAHACGTPAIAFGQGGAADALLDGTTGIFFDEQTPQSLGTALDRFSKMSFDRLAVREYARQFSASRFRARFDELVRQAMRDRKTKIG